MNFVSWLAAAILLIASASALVNRDWRVQLGALTLQYFTALWLITRHLPFAMGAAKLVAGWMAVAVLGMTCLSLNTSMEEDNQIVTARDRWLPVILISVITLIALGVTPRIEAVIPGLGLQVIAGSLILIGAGLIHLSITADILRVIASLLTILTGFEIIYAAVESSILVAGLLAVITLGLSLVGSYLLIANYSPKTEDGQS